MLLGQELKFKNKLCNLKLGTFFSALLFMNVLSVVFTWADTFIVAYIKKKIITVLFRTFTFY